MKTLITIDGSTVSSRLDMTREILIIESDGRKQIGEAKTILLDKSSAEDICSFIIKEDISCIICGGIEEKHFKYLLWKNTRVIDSIIGSYQEALELYLKEELEAGAILAGARNMWEFHD